MEQNRKIRTLTGKVVSDKMNKTAVVLFERKVRMDGEKQQVLDRLQKPQVETVGAPS